MCFFRLAVCGCGMYVCLFCCGGRTCLPQTPNLLWEIAEDVCPRRGFTCGMRWSSARLSDRRAVGASSAAAHGSPVPSWTPFYEDVP